MAAPSRTARTREGAATLRLAASSVAPVPCGYERGWVGPDSEPEVARRRDCGPDAALRLQARDAGVSRLASTIATGGDR
jgi:hypothetical protein